MVLIFSESHDQSTNRVMDWVQFLEKDCVRVNNDNIFGEYNPVDIEISTDMAVTSIGKNIESIWFRKGLEPSLALEAKIDKEFFQLNGTGTSYGLKREHQASKQAIFYLASEESKSVLGNHENYEPNKIRMLSLAKKNGINIPKTLITSERKRLVQFFESCDGLIVTKAVQDGINLTTETDGEAFHLLQYTEPIDKKILEKLPERFFPSLFQEKIEKEYEIRVFFIEGKTFSMAIFSQNDPKTQIDYRRYNMDRGNRNIPFKLPSDLKRNIKLLMQDLNLNTGSLDFIRGKDGSYVFLEVNPCGQFGMVSNPCNFALHKVIAEYLTNKNVLHEKIPPTL